MVGGCIGSNSGWSKWSFEVLKMDDGLESLPVRLTDDIRSG